MLSPYTRPSWGHNHSKTWGNGIAPMYKCMYIVKGNKARELQKKLSIQFQWHSFTHITGKWRSGKLCDYRSNQTKVSVTCTVSKALRSVLSVTLVYIEWWISLTRQIHIEWQSKHNYVYVIYKVLVYVQTSQPTTCFGLFQLGHLQVGHKGQRKYPKMQNYH